MNELPQQAEIVIIGGGVMGASTAYHLARRGCTDILLLERQEFWGMGATGKCAGGIRSQFSTEINIRLSQFSLSMLDRFEEEIGQAIVLRRPGSSTCGHRGVGDVGGPLGGARRGDCRHHERSDHGREHRHDHEAHRPPAA